MRISDWSSDVCSSDLQAGVVELDVEDRHRRRRGGGRCGQRQREQQTGEQDGAAHPDTAHYEEGSTSIGQDCSNTLSSESTTRACRTSEPCSFTKKRKVGFSLIEMSPSKLRNLRPPRISSTRGTTWAGLQIGDE